MICHIFKINERTFHLSNLVPQIPRVKRKLIERVLGELFISHVVGLFRYIWIAMVNTLGFAVADYSTLETVKPQQLRNKNDIRDNQYHHAARQRAERPRHLNVVTPFREVWAPSKQDPPYYKLGSSQTHWWNRSRQMMLWHISQNHKRTYKLTNLLHQDKFPSAPTLTPKNEARSECCGRPTQCHGRQWAINILVGNGNFEEATRACDYFHAF